MKSRLLPFILIALILNLGLTAYLLVDRDSASPEQTKSPPSKSDHTPKVGDLALEVSNLKSELDMLRLAQTDGAPPTTLNDRLAGLETSIAKLNSQMDGISLEDASAERSKLFIGENGFLKADEYYEAGKFAIAGEGYLAFLEAHPDHPDHRSILERARDAFTMAKYAEKALWVQEGLLRIYPENKGDDLMTLAQMEQEAGRYKSAIEHAEESAENLDASQKYWSKLYAAWYTELDQGLQAGLDYHRQVQQEIIDAGLADGRLGERVQEKIDELEQQLASPALSSTK